MVAPRSPRLGGPVHRTGTRHDLCGMSRQTARQYIRASLVALTLLIREAKACQKLAHSILRVQRSRRSDCVDNPLSEVVFPCIIVRCCVPSSWRERTLLDNTVVLFCSSMLTGSHDNSQLPVLLCGRAGGQLESGRVLDYRESDNRRMSSLYLSLMDKMGLRLEEFGDSSQRLAEI